MIYTYRDLGEAYRCVGGVTTAAAATANSGGHIHNTSIGGIDKANDDINNAAANASATASINAQQVKTSDIYNQVRFQ
jgi:hypothetical protein